MRWPAGGSLVLLVTLVLGVGVASAASAPPVLSGTGTVEGDLKAGSSVIVKLSIRHREGLQHIAEIDVDLDLRTRFLDRLQFRPGASIIEIIGFGPPARLGQSGVLRGAYFDIDPSKVSLTAKGSTLRITTPITLQVAPPPGARLTFAAADDTGLRTRYRALTPPVESVAGFSVGTLLLAIAVALFAGGFIGNLVTGGRKKTARPSVYEALQRKIDEEASR